MANFVPNIGKGRGVELYNRVENNDPGTSAFILIPYSLSGSEAQGQDLDDAAAFESDANWTEITTNNWTRKTLTDAELAAFPAPDDGNNRYDVSVPQVSWSGPAPSAGGDTQGLGIFYDSNTGAGTDSNLLPVTQHTFVVEGDGNDVVLNAGVFLRAS